MRKIFIFLLFLLISLSTTGCHHLFHGAQVLPYKEKEITYYATVPFPERIIPSPLGINLRMGLGKKFEINSFFDGTSLGTRIVYQILKEKGHYTPALAAAWEVNIGGPLNYYLITSKRIGNLSDEVYFAYKRTYTNFYDRERTGHAFHLGWRVSKGKMIYGLELYKSYIFDEFGYETEEIKGPPVEKIIYIGFCLGRKL